MIDPRGRKFLVTGGTGFIGSALVRGLVHRGAHVRCLDNNSRGATDKLGDVVDLDWSSATFAILRPCVWPRRMIPFATSHINGTEFFYDRPELILEVASRA
jgi:nucleoside-diphosphate-sugar epimerase